MPTAARPNDKVRVREHYDRMSPYYHSPWGEHIHHGYSIRGDESKGAARVQLIEHLAEAAGVQPDAQILDVGCGLGARHLSGAAVRAKATGITVSRCKWKWPTTPRRPPESTPSFCSWTGRP